MVRKGTKGTEAHRHLCPSRVSTEESALQGKEAQRVDIGVLDFDEEVEVFQDKFFKNILDLLSLRVYTPKCKLQ